MPSERRKPPPVVGNKFSLEKKLGAGCFGEVYRGKNEETGQIIAIKTEDTTTGPAPQLEQEYRLLQELKGPVPVQGFAECYYFGQEQSKDGGAYNCMVMELLGKSLEDRVQNCQGKYTPKTTALVAQQVLTRIEFLHSKGHVHRDIKPENFMFGIDAKIHHIYIIDFGLSKKYWDKGKHAQCKQKLSLTGTARYASINAHKGVEQSRRDDLEAIGHMFMYFLRGSVPWSGLDARTKIEKYRKIMEKKEQVPLEELCKGFPPAFQSYLDMARKLQFMEKPDYEYMQKLFMQVREAEKPFSEKEPTKDWEYEWFEKEPPKPTSGTLVPLEKWVKIRQPDDPEEAQPKARRAEKVGRCGCFGGKSAVRE